MNFPKTDFVYGFIAGWIFNYTGIIGLVIGILIGIKMIQNEKENSEATKLGQDENNIPISDFLLDKTKTIFKKILYMLEKEEKK